MSRQIISPVIALALSGIKYGDFQVATLNNPTYHTPDYDLVVADYVSHGGRIIFDYQALDEDKKQMLHEVLSVIQKGGSRRFSTHALVREGQEVREKKLGLVKSIAKGSTDTGIDFSVYLPDKGERSGHALFVDKPDDHCFMIGFENASADISSVLRGEHSPFGKGNKTTWAGEKKLDDLNYIQQQSMKNVECPVKYNGMKVILSNNNIGEVLALLVNEQHKPESEQTYQVDDSIYSDYPKCNHSEKNLAGMMAKVNHDIANKRYRKWMKYFATAILFGLMTPVLVFHPLAVIILGCYAAAYLLVSFRKDLSKFFQDTMIQNLSLSLCLLGAITLIVVSSLLLPCINTWIVLSFVAAILMHQATQSIVFKSNIEVDTKALIVTAASAALAIVFSLAFDPSILSVISPSYLAIGFTGIFVVIMLLDAQMGNIFYQQVDQNTLTATPKQQPDPIGANNLSGELGPTSVNRVDISDQDTVPTGQTSQQISK
ncbi:hypothetical protein N9Y17_00305 [Gammaproteobacteria bacterium]|nr:hypothetical protein [Gammaproteobacteria bacterium]